MASFTGVGDNVELLVADREEQVDIAISGTYDMTIELQREVGSPGSGAWEALKQWTTADATVAYSHYTTRYNENLRLIVLVDTSGTATATLTNAVEEGIGYRTIKDRVGNTLMSFAQDGATIAGWVSALGRGAVATNVAFGTDALDANTSGSENTALGYQAGDAITTGDENTAVGASAMGACTTGADNVAVGANALDAMTIGINNIAIGKDAAGALTTGNDNVAVGHSALDAATTGVENVAIGTDALGTLTTGANNIGIGDDAILVATTATNNVAIGTDAMVALTTGTDNVAIGTAALDAATTAVDNVAIGSNALGAMTIGVNNVAIGDDAATGLTTGNDNIAIGKAALDASTTAIDNIAIGSNALGVNTIGDNNVAVGFQALDANTTGVANVAVGSDALGANITGINNVAMGNDALLVAAGATDDDNVAVGFEAFKALNGGAGENTAVGSQAGLAVTTGDNNTMIGRASGGTLTTGSNNICIGADTDVSATSSANQFAIGKGVVNTADKAIVIGDASDHVRNDWGSDATWDKVSDIRMKNVLRESEAGLEFLQELTPIVYTKKPVEEWPAEWGIDPEEYPTDTETRLHGMSAQDVWAAMKLCGVEDFSGVKVEPNGKMRLSEQMFIYPLINAVNELAARVEELEAELG
jgi:hypothetical protein